ncbi:MAG: redoxin domain-containing protein [Phycisphaerales bacterium]|nr:redoxin domain-containing protein [Phycisphaerales bacterium]MCI0631406.1 redoxin domain-containing protein [Phycisphaerales bacterium]
MALKKQIVLAIAIAAVSLSTVGASDDPIISQAGDSAQPKAQAEALFKAAQDAYRKLSSYQDTFQIRYDAKLKDDAGDGPPPGMEEQEGSLKFARPNRIVLLTAQRTVCCDGKTLTVRWDQLGQYTQESAPAELALDNVAMQPGFGFMSDHPALDLLLTKAGSDPLRDFKKITSVTAEELNGEPGQRIAGEIQPDSYPFEVSMPISVWLSDATHLIGQVRVDLKPFFDTMAEQSRALGGEEEEEEVDEEEEDHDDLPQHDQDPEEGEDAQDEDDGAANFSMPKYDKLDVIISLNRITLNEDIAPQVFAFKPESGDEKVEEFQFGGDDSQQQELVGKPAPDFTGLDLEGKPVSLADYRGRVVMLDFWATWCGPCVQAIPHIQKLADKFADKPVTVLGMNRDQPGSESRVKKFLEKKKITFRQVMPQDADEAGEGESIAEKYFVQGIPCSVLIDQQGIVQSVHVGFMPGAEDELAEQIESLLAGKSLFDPAEIAQRERDGAAEESTPDQPSEPPAATSGALEEVAPERLVDGGKAPGQIYAYQAQRIDVDDDGAQEIVTPSTSGGLDIISSDGASLKRLKLKGVKQGSSLNAIKPIRLDGRLHWLIGSTRYGMTGNQTEGEVALHDGEGQRLWSYKPQLPEKFTCTMVLDAGDLDGDGAPEFVIGINSYKFQSSNRQRFMMPTNQSAFVSVLDREGSLTSQRRAGKTIEFLHVTPARNGQRGTIICVGDSRLRRFTFDPTAIKSEPAEGAPAP